MTPRMQFTITGTKALPYENEITVHDLTTFTRRSLRCLQQFRIIHAASWTNLKNAPDGRMRARIEIDGIYPN